MEYINEKLDLSEKIKIRRSVYEAFSLGCLAWGAARDPQKMLDSRKTCSRSFTKFGRKWVQDGDDGLILRWDGGNQLSFLDRSVWLQCVTQNSACV